MVADGINIISSQLFVFQEHQYCLPTAAVLRQRLHDADVARESLLRKLRNAGDREKRAKATCRSMTRELNELHLINDEIKCKLDSYKGW